MDDSLEAAPGSDAGLTVTEVARLRSTWFELETGDVDVAERFYERLFAVAPELRSLFRGDMPSQRRKFMSTLALIVDSIDAPQDIAAMVTELGQRHVDFGVEERHYAVVGDVLLATLAECLEEQFDAVANTAWQKAYVLLADAMQDASEEDAIL